MIANCRGRGDEVRAGSMGRPTPGYEVALLDDELREAPIGEQGEIAVRVATRRPLGLFREYWRNPDETPRISAATGISLATARGATRRAAIGLWAAPTT